MLFFCLSVEFITLKLEENMKGIFYPVGNFSENQADT